jgi:hypothetical protein
MAVAGFKPLILGSRGKCSTTVLPRQKTAHELTPHFFLSPSVNGRIQTLDLRIRRPVFYHCTTKVKCNLLYLPPPHIFLSLPMTVGGFKPLFLGSGGKCFTSVLLFQCQWPDSNLWSWDYEAMFCHCATTAKHKYINFSPVFLPLPMTVAGFKPLILGSWGKCFTTVLLR